MDDETQQLEAELKRLRPVVPSRQLMERIESELAASSTSRPRSKTILFWLGGLSAAAGVALLLQFGGPRLDDGTLSSPPLQALTPTDAPLKPVAAENVLVSANDEGLVTLDDGTPARRERLHFVDTITWRNPRTNASLRWSVPREEVRVIPLALQ